MKRYIPYKFKEIRKNPDMNPHIGAWDCVDKYKDDKDVYISFTEIDKIGINPKSKFNTPVGIYTYPLREFVKNYCFNPPYENNKEIRTVGSYAPFAGSAKYISFLKVKDKSHFIEDMYKDYGSDKFDKDVKILENKYSEILNKDIIEKTVFFVFDELENVLNGASLDYGNASEENKIFTLVRNVLIDTLDVSVPKILIEKNVKSKIKELKKCLIDKEDKIYFSFILEDILNKIDNFKFLISTWIDQAKDKNPIMSMWNITRKLSQYLSDNEKQTSTKWNLILSKDLGYSGFADKSGKGYIHPSEPMQAVFFNTRAFDVIAREENKPTKKQGQIK